MPTVPPRTVLSTHEVANQPPVYGGVNLYQSDTALREAVRFLSGDWLDARLRALGHDMGQAEMLEAGHLANRHAPELLQFDRFGHRLDEVRFHPCYHQLMEAAMRHRVHDLAWDTKGNAPHLAHSAMLAVLTQAEAGVMCPMNMTYASVASLRGQGARAETWADAVIGGQYDAPLAPIASKRGVTIGMAMTEKQGGSDVRANTTKAVTRGDAYSLTGHKWFCSAPMCDGFLTLAYLDGALSCFLVPRVCDDGSRNRIELQRLKDKLGNRSNASSEIEYNGAEAYLIGTPGRGVNAIIEMVHHTRLGTISATLGIMRAALARAVHHVQHRRAFQKRLIDQPAMASVIADLQLDYEAAVAMVAQIAALYHTQDEDGFVRLGVALAKFYLTKRCPNFVYECLECLGGAGYVEDSDLPRLYREAPLNAIWEGSGNVIALDILRTLHKVPVSGPALVTFIADQDPALAKTTRSVLETSCSEAQARHLAETLARHLQQACLIRSQPHLAPQLADRKADRNFFYGAQTASAQTQALLDRAQI